MAVIAQVGDTSSKAVASMNTLQLPKVLFMPLETPIMLIDKGYGLR